MDPTDSTDLTDLEKRLLDAATEGNELDCQGGVIHAEVIRALLIHGHRTDRLDPRGIRLTDAHISGELDLQGVTAEVPLGFTDCVFDQPIVALHATLKQLSIEGGRLPRILADSLHVTGDLFLRDGLRIHNDGELDGIRMVGATVDGDLDLSGAIVAGGGHPALNAGGLTAKGNVFLRDGFTATGHSEVAATVSLRNATIGGGLDCDGATVTSDHGPALDLSLLTTTGNVSMSAGFRASGSTESGTVRMHFANIGGLECANARIDNGTGPALRADGLTVTSSVFFIEGFIAAGRGPYGTIRLPGAEIRGDLDMGDCRSHNPDGPAIVLSDVRTGRFQLDPGAPCRDGRPGDPDTWRGEGTLGLEGLSYRSLLRSGIYHDLWLFWIRYKTPEYAAQPYQQFAQYLRSLGHETEARKVLMAQQDDALRRGAITGVMPRLRHWLFGGLLGYGYQTSRAVVALMIVVELACAVGLGAGNRPIDTGGYAAQRPDGTACSTIEQIGLGLERGLPVISTGLSGRCVLDTASLPGQLYTAAGWILQVAAWALATLVVAGYTGLIRKRE